MQASQQEIELMKQEMAKISGEELHFLFDMLLKGEREMTFCFDSQLVLEVLLLRLCNAPRLESILPLNPLSLDKKKPKITQFESGIDLLKSGNQTTIQGKKFFRSKIKYILQRKGNSS